MGGLIVRLLVSEAKRISRLVSRWVAGWVSWRNRSSWLADSPLCCPSVEVWGRLSRRGCACRVSSEPVLYVQPALYLVTRVSSGIARVSPLQPGSLLLIRDT